jgi:plasmid stabilization system protein ParE
MSYQVEILPQALSEIENSFRWIADNIGSTTAERWYEDLLEAIRSLESFPNRCALAPEAEAFQREIRQLWIGKAKNYRALFIVETKQVFILHVRHSSRAVLKQDPPNSET